MKRGSAALESEPVATGILKKENGQTFLRDERGNRRLEGEIIWDGYLAHWNGRQLNARHLSEGDYVTGSPIVLLWPLFEDPETKQPYIEIYYSERLVKYRGSRFGHSALNINGTVFNFSYRINENEMIPVEEYFYRPALGPFAPHPIAGRHLDGPGHGERVYYDNFGRLFMRTIHVLRIEGASLDTKRLFELMKRELDTILQTPSDPEYPNIYKDFHFYKRNCTTLIRDGLREIGFKKMKGIAPRDFFINASYFFHMRGDDLGLSISHSRKKQLKVMEAPYSVPAPLINPINMIKNSTMMW
jgi:hypothetical protein